MLEILQQADTRLLLFLNSFHAPFWDSFMWLFTAKLTWVPMYATILYVLYKNFNPRLCLFTLIAIVLTIVFADQVCASIIRPAVERMRPSNINNPISEFVHLVNGKRGGRYGFPSCHAANSFGLAFFIVLLFKNRTLSLFILLWATINSFSRVYIGVHYPGDLLAGTIVGLIGALLCYGLFRAALKSPKIATSLHYGNNRGLIEHPAQIEHTRTIMYMGLITMLCFAVYSLFV